MKDVKNCTPQPGGAQRPRDRLLKTENKTAGTKHQDDTRSSTHFYFGVLS